MIELYAGTVNNLGIAENRYYNLEQHTGTTSGYINSNRDTTNTNIKYNVWHQTSTITWGNSNTYSVNTGTCLATDIDWNGTWNTDNGFALVLSPSDRMREILRSRNAPTIIGSRRSLSIATDIREIRARATLRGMLGLSFFRKFLRDGFIAVISKSGLTYRFYPGLRSTEVYDRGVKVETMCVVLDGNFPPTDELIMRYLLILNDEGEFSKHAVRHRISLARPVKLEIPFVEERSLSEIFAKLKAVA